MAAALVSSLTPEELNALSNVPALAPPPGIESDFINPQNQSLSFLLVTSILFGIMTIFFLNRIYTKAFIIRKYTWDDCVQKGKLGVHQWDINIPDILSLDLLIPEYLASILTEVALLFTKATFFFMYLSIFGPLLWMRISARLGLLVNTGFYVAVLVANMIFSTPRPGQSWQEAVVSEQGTLALSIPQAVGGLIIDLFILALPIIAVSKLQLPRQRKIGVILIFMSGALAVAASILKPAHKHTSQNYPLVSHVLVCHLPLIPVGIMLPLSNTNSPTLPSADQNGLLEKNQDGSSDPYPRLENHGIASQGWIHDQQFRSPETHSQRYLPKSVPIIVSGGEQDVMEQSHNQHSYTRLGSQKRSSPKRPHPPTAAHTLTSGGGNFERNREPFSKLDDYWLHSERIDDDVPPPVPPKEFRQTLPLAQPRAFRPPKPVNTAIGGGN
ncbi:hypothetical protein MMC27_006969 [Xylographa pallens]|nr:hypothetical protein [Xylographa pallens]